MPPGRHLVIINPAARHGEADRMTPVIEALLGSVPHDSVETTGPGHAAELAAAAADHDVVVAAGGDGTVHEVLNGLMRIPEAHRPALGILPTGSGNDTCRTLGIPFELPDAARVLSDGSLLACDVGLCNGIHFSNSFAAGLDAKVTAKAVEYKVTKRRSGLWLYLTALLHVLFRDLGSFHVSLSLDGAPPVETDTLIIAVTNGPTYGGGFRITPGSDPTDGVFDVCMIDPLGLPGALARLPFVVLGRHTGMSVVHMSRHRSLIIECDTPLPAQIDGEVLVEKRYDVSILPGAVRCVVPGAEAR